MGFVTCLQICISKQEGKIVPTAEKGHQEGEWFFGRMISLKIKVIEAETITTEMF